MPFSENLLCAAPHVPMAGATLNVLLGAVGLMVAASLGKAFP